MFKQQFYFKF